MVAPANIPDTMLVVSIVETVDVGETLFIGNAGTMEFSCKEVLLFVTFPPKPTADMDVLTLGADRIFDMALCCPSEATA